jgi:endonuclease-8
MPEGPSIVILKEAVEEFRGRKVIAATGNTQKVDLQQFTGQVITDFKSWGKHFLICFPNTTLRIHFMLFGSYRINEGKSTPARLSLQFDDGELNFYACSVQQIDTPLDEIYDWSADVMNPDWNPAKAEEKLKSHPTMLVCDALLDQHIFSGVGNIIKNEVLFRVHIHPKTQVGALPPGKLHELISEAVIYSFDFLTWKKEFTLRKHWLAHTKKTCPRDGMPLIKEYLGKTNRRTFYCEFCQELYVA